MDACPIEELRIKYGDIREAQGSVYSEELIPFVVLKPKNSLRPVPDLVSRVKCQYTCRRLGVAGRLTWGPLKLWGSVVGTPESPREPEQLPGLIKPASRNDRPRRGGSQ
jgi:hypothetical protein